MKELHQVYQQVFGRSDKVSELFAPYRVCPLGAHVDHQHGLVTGFAIDKGIRFVFSPTSSGEIDVISQNFDGRVTFSIHDHIDGKRHHWGDYLRGVVSCLQQDYQLERGIRAVVKGELPIGGLSSSAALLCGFVVCLSAVNGLSLDRMQVIHYASIAERRYIGLHNGILDHSCVMLCEKDKLLFMDTATSAYKKHSFGSKEHTGQISSPVSNRLPIKIGIFFSGVTRRLVNTNYNKRVEECRAAARMIQALARRPLTTPDNTFLRDIPEELFLKWKSLLPLPLSRRAQQFYGDCRRVVDALDCWEQGDIIRFGKLMDESCDSSIHLYECGSEELKVLSALCRQCDGIYGGRFAGAGFKGAYVALVDPLREEEIRGEITARYLNRFPLHADAFRIFFCDLADGMMLNRQTFNLHRYGISNSRSRICYKDVPTNSAFPQAVVTTGA